MRATKLALVLAVSLAVSDAALAQPDGWEVVGESDSAVTSALFKSMRRNGARVVLWVMHNHGKPQGVSEAQRYRSVKMLYEVDCQTESLGIKSFVRYRLASGQGDVVNSRTVEYVSLEPAVPDSIGEAIVQRACARSN